MCLKFISFLNRSRIRHPLASGSFTSSVTAMGLYLLTRSKTLAKLVATTARRFNSWAFSIMIFANRTSSSMTNTTLSPLTILFRSSPISLIISLRASRSFVSFTLMVGTDCRAIFSSEPSANLYTLGCSVLCFSFFIMAGL